MNRFSHGGNVFEISRESGCAVDEIIDLSASINPLGPPEGLREKIVEQYHLIKHYPDIGNSELITALSRFHGISEENIAVGNGSTELLYWLPYAFDWNRVALVVPTFSEYMRTLENKRVIVRKLICRWETSFQPTLEQLDALIHASKPDAVFLTHPGSPSGVPLEREVIEFIKDSCDKEDFYWVIDEVFIDFIEELSLKSLIAHSDKIIIIRSLTKFYSLPGVRLGYMFASKEAIERVRNFLPPWSVNVFAQIAGVFCLNNRNFVDETISFFDRERARVIQRLKSIPHVSVLPSTTNYVLIRIADEVPVDAYSLSEELFSRHKILIRNCANFDGLNSKYVRIAIYSKEINDLWLQALESIFKQEGNNIGRIVNEN